MNFITKLKVQQWVRSSLQLAHLYQWDILKSNFISVCTFKDGELLAEYIKDTMKAYLCYRRAFF